MCQLIRKCAQACVRECTTTHFDVRVCARVCVCVCVCVCVFACVCAVRSIYFVCVLPSAHGLDGTQLRRRLRGPTVLVIETVRARIASTEFPSFQLCTTAKCRASSYTIEGEQTIMLNVRE